MRIGCPECEAVVSAPIPPGTGIQTRDPDAENRLRGTETSCGNCGHELELYYY